jgi:hypothetical protein
MAIRQFVFENLIGDLEYHPKLAAVYLALASAALCGWIFSPADSKLSVAPLVFGFGSLALFLKGVFFLRKSSDGLGLSYRGLDLSQRQVVNSFDTSATKAFPGIPSLAAQLIQDFGAGGLLLGPVLHIGNDVSDSSKALPSLAVFSIGAALFALGWLIRRIASRDAFTN